MDGGGWMEVDVLSSRSKEESQSKPCLAQLMVFRCVIDARSDFSSGSSQPQDEQVS